ncbi:hypothetical protein AbraIFM66950_009139 [Aspergillus brasiliensis]|nr:hypothetical protein AbraIFM66950_009139 [Aspergillus brasiliensis]
MEPPAFMPSQPSLCTLPVELTQAILCHLPDLESLKSAQLTHSALYHAFLGAEDLITGEVLTREIPTDLFPDAVFAFNASTVEGRWARDKVQSILYQHRNRQIPSSFRLTRKSAFAIYGLYRWVRYFARDFLATALADPWHGLTHPAIPSRPPTLTEECRVARALYRFEIHRHLFRMREPYEGYSKDSPDFRVGEQWGYYFRHFPVWELEQIMSVCEHLFRRIAICESFSLSISLTGLSRYWILIVIQTCDHWRRLMRAGSKRVSGIIPAMSA